LVVLFLSMTGLYNVHIPLSHDIKSMLPDKDERFREDFELFSYAPFARNILISLEVSDTQDQTSAQGDVSADILTQAADKITESLKPPLFVQAVSGISQSEKLKLFNWMFDRLPCLVNEEDIAFLKEQITPASIDRQLQENIKVLHSPESVVLKKLILQDPLAFRRLLLVKLQQLNMMSGFSVDSDYFLSKDNKHLLIIAETSITITDFGGSRKMLDYLYRVLDEFKPQGIQYRVICGHRYTVANAETIQSDLWRVFAVSITGLLLIFVIFLHNWRALFVLVMPASALLIGVAVTALFFGTVSTITIGFGAVLLGISVDFGLHVFYGLQQEHTDTRRVLAELTKPLSFCALTTIGVFAVLLFSNLPGQRQLAVFSITGIVTALLFALFLMPHLMPARPVLSLKNLSLPRARAFTVPLWIFIALVAAIPATRVSFDGNIRSIGMIPKDVLEDELQIKDTWGAVREQALVFCAAESPEEALQKNDVLFQKLKHEMPKVEFLSLASLIPSRQAQEKNLQRWSDFWNDSDRKAILRTNLEQQGLRYGFTSAAFESFLQWLGQPPGVFALDDFEKECNDKLISPFVAELKNGQYAILTFVPDDEAVATFLQKMEKDIKIVSNRQFSMRLNRETVSDFTQFFSWAIIIIFVLLFILFRNGKKLVLAFLPVLAGILIMSAIISVIGIKVNLFNMVAAVLVIGLAADYGIFIVCTCAKAPNIATLNAVLVSGLTTFVGFGSLIIARHPAMNSIGITVAAGIIPSLLCALTLLPYLTVLFLAAKPK
jgi:predicted exporter